MSNHINNYKDLIVWQKSMDLVCCVYRLTRTFPKEEIYGLTSQLRRASISVPSNIAEGQGRKSSGEFKQFLSIARGSLAEVETQIMLSEKLEYVHDSSIAAEARSLILECRKMLCRLINSI